MANNSGDSGDKSQADKFREAAREHETDDSEERFDKIVGKIAKSGGDESLVEITHQIFGNDQLGWTWKVLAGTKILKSGSAPTQEDARAAAQSVVDDIKAKSQP